jgi:hypothetical protein
MRRYGPLLTVLVVAVVGAVLFIANSAGNPANQPAAAAVVAASPAAAPSAGATPSPAAAAAAATPPAATPAAAAPVVAQKAYAGRTAGREMTIAVAVKDGRAVAYICDGKKVEAWLQGTLSGSELTLRGTATVTGTVDAGKVTGSITVNGRSYPFTAAAVTAPAGLYQGRADVKGVATKIGWIVLGDGSQTGIRTPAGGVPGPAPALDPTRLDGVTVDGAPVTIKVIGGSDEVIG